MYHSTDTTSEVRNVPHTHPVFNPVSPTTLCLNASAARGDTIRIDLGRQTTFGHCEKKKNIFWESKPGRLRLVRALLLTCAQRTRGHSGPQHRFLDHTGEYQFEFEFSCRKVGSRLLHHRIITEEDISWT